MSIGLYFIGASIALGVILASYRWYRRSNLGLRYYTTVITDPGLPGRRRITAVKALERIDDLRAVEPLLRVLGETHVVPEARGDRKDCELIRTTAHALLRRGWDPRQGTLHEAGRFRVIMGLWDDVVEMGEDALPSMAALADCCDAELWRTFGRIGLSAVPVLARFVGYGHHPKERHALQALLDIGTPALPVLCDLALQESGAITTLKHMGSRVDKTALHEWVVPGLANALSDTRSRVGVLGPAEALAALATRIEQATLARSVVPAFFARSARCKDEVQFDGLFSALATVARSAGRESITAAREFLRAQPQLSALAALARLGDVSAVDRLLAALQDTDNRVSAEAARALGKSGSPKAVSFLIAALHSAEPGRREMRAPSPSPRAAAADSLGKLGDARAVEALIAALADDDWDVYAAAAESLGKLGDARAVEALIASLRYRERLVGHYNSGRGIWENNSRALVYAALSLAQLRDPRAVRPLTKLLSRSTTPRWVSAAAIDALEKIGGTDAELALAKERTRRGSA